jgi:DNA-binding beta-propeller fold protein YncE
MSLRHSVLCALAVAASAAAQTENSTQTVWVLDQTAADIKVLNGAVDAVVVQTIPLLGSGQVRGFGFDAEGTAFVCRADEVRTYDGFGSAIFANATQGVVQAQDVAVDPATGDVYVACGVSSLASKILRFDSQGTLLATLVNADMVHPRRMSWRPDGSLLYVACSGNNRVLEYDPDADTFATTFDFASAGVTPIGVSFDVVRSGLWIVDDWGGMSGGVGFLQLAPGTVGYFPLITTTTTAGLAAPASVVFDRMRNLYVAGRGQNGGTAGVYVYAAATGTTPTFVKSVTGLGQLNVIEVEPRPELVVVDAPPHPNDPTLPALLASFSAPTANALQFVCPAAANQVYYAGLSLRWPSQCAPYAPGVFDAAFEFPGGDPRGLPTLNDNFFRQTAGVCCFGATPPLSAAGDFPLPPFMNVSGFAGFLDGTGAANAAVNFSAGIPVSLDGTVFSVMFVTIDPSVSTLFGRVSDAFCLTLAVAP